MSAVIYWFTQYVYLTAYWYICSYATYISLLHRVCPCDY